VDTVDMDDITHTSDKYQDNDTVDAIKDVKLSFTDTLKDCYKGIIDSLMLDPKTVQNLDVIQLPDRFGAKFVQKMYWKTEKDSLCLMDWEFKDSIKTATAFYNWLDCFGNSCKTIKIGDNVKIHPRNILILVNENHLFSIDSNLKIDQEKWLKMLKDQSIGENWKFIVSQPKRGKATWMSLKDEIFTEIKNQN
jgi:hypothetical protein